jgi:RimJ/RimL family protein N-acetyltransferase
MTDPGNATGLVLDALAAAGIEAEVDVVLGSAAPHLDAVRARCAALPGARLYLDYGDMAGLMAGADLAAGAAGVSSLERCCLGLPTLLLVIADNQRDVAGQLASAGALVNLGEAGALDAATVAAGLRALWHDPDRLAALGRAAATICDGLGALRIAQTVRPERGIGGAAVTLRPATAADGSLMLDWQRHPETRRFARNSRPPDAAEHWAWLARKLADPGCIFTIIEEDGVPAGVLRLDRSGLDGEPEQGYEVSILVAPDRYRRGLGLAALRLARRLVPEAPLLAEILPGNAGSAALFARAGFVPGPHRLINPLAGSPIEEASP